MKEPFKIQNEFKTARERALVVLTTEKVNLGKTSYSEYLKEAKRKFNDDGRKLRLLEAKHTIEELKKFRKENNIDFDFC